VVLLALAGLLPSLGFAQGGSEVTAHIADFYRWYLLERAAQHDPLLQSPERLREYVTVQRIRALERAQQADALETDYFLTTQDWPDGGVTEVRVGAVRRIASGTAAVVRLTADSVHTLCLEVLVVRRTQGVRIAAVRVASSKGACADLPQHPY